MPGEDAPFAERLRRLRESAGLTQEELASRAGLTAKAVSALERGERKRPYPHTVRSLADALALTVAERADLQAAIPRRGAETSASPAAAPAAVSEPTLPGPRTPLVGREQELGEIGLFLDDRGVRLLTLTGTGGVGKTRLALQAAREVAGLFPDGVVFVALASLGDPALVLPTIAQSLGLREAEHRTPREAIRAFLKDKKFLLVLDNLEHLLGVAPEVADLVEDRPGLSVLATSRAPLRVRGEQAYPVEPLDLPSSTRSPSAEDVAASPSGRLFVERATAASPNFSLTPRTPGPSPRSAGASTASRSRWSSPRPRRGSSTPPRSSRAWTAPSRRAGRATCPTASERCARRWTGATTCSLGRRGLCLGGSRSSPGGSRWKRPRR